MNKQVPYIFEDATFYEKLTPVYNLDRVGRTRMKAFYRGKNRNGSFITPEIADQLIESATRGNTPIIGFYNYEERDFERHMGPQLAKGYGYVPKDCNFAWEIHVDEYGVEKEYACFDCILFCDYFEEAKEIIGKPQSMELKQDTIRGEWEEFEDGEYFVYSSAEMKGFCVLGSTVEPCFEAASFFEKDGGSKFDKFSLLLSDLMEKVKEAELKEEGGEKEMPEEVIVSVPEVEETVVEEVEETAPVVEEETTPVIEKEETTPVTEEETPTVEEVPSVSFEEIQAQLDEMTTNFNSLTEEKAVLQNKISELENQLSEMTLERDNLKNDVTSLHEQLNTEKNKVACYEAQIQEIEMAKKEKLVSDYEKVLSEEEINEVKPSLADFTYDELESKLAVSYSRKNLRSLNSNRVPIPEPEKTGFAELMKKYKK